MVIHIGIARTYYFRPTADPNSAEARTCAGQWLSALDFALSKLLDGGKTLYNKNPLKVHRVGFVVWFIRSCAHSSVSGQRL